MVRYEDSHGDWYEYRVTLSGSMQVIESRSRTTPNWSESRYFTDMDSVHKYFKIHCLWFKLIPFEISYESFQDKSGVGNVFDYGYGMSTTSAQKHKCTCLWATVWARGCQCNGE